MARSNRESGHFFIERKSRENRNKLVAILGCMVVLATAVALMVPALSMTRSDAICGMEEHVHTDACYEQVLACGLDESDSHEHTDACYETQLTCELSEHEHSAACFASADEGAGSDGAVGAGEAGAGEGAGADASDGGESGAASAGANADASGAAGDNGQGATSAATADTASDAGAGAAGSGSALQDASDTAAASDATTAKLDVQSANMPAQEFQADLKDENDNVVLTVAVKAPKGAFPENAFMKIDGIPVEDVQDQVEAALSDAGLNNPEVKQAEAVDITFFNEAGEPIEPAKKIEVKIAAAGLQDAEDPMLVHVAESNDVVKSPDGTVTDRDGKPFADAADKYESAEVVKKVKQLDPSSDGPSDTMAALSFKADEFSPYVIVYTVDFHYTDEAGETVEWSWPGEGSYSVESIMGELGVFNKVENAELERVIDEGGPDNALYLEQKDGGWYLTSDTKFVDTFELTVEAGGHTYIVTITDVSHAMEDAVASATLNGQSGSTWTVKAGEEYTVHLEFEENPSTVQFDTMGNTLTYQLPNNFKPRGNLDATPITLTYTEESVTHTITGCTYSVDSNGQVTINLSDFAKEKLASSGDGKIKIDIKGIFTQTNEHTDFGGGNVKNVVVDDTKDVSISKTGNYNSSDNKVHYKVTVKADGSLTNVNVNDAISGTALTMDQDSLTYSGNSSTPTGGATNNGFNVTFPTMKNGETITIEYTASVNWDVIGEGKGTVEQTGNTVKVKPHGVPEKEEPTNLENRITYNPLAKSAGDVQDTSDPDVKTVPWTITLNAQGLKNMKNTTITDHNNSTNVMHYSGDGIVIEKFAFNQDGSTTSQGTKSLSWDQLGIDPETDASWSYTIPDDGKYKYVITYTTQVDVSGQNGNTYVNNSVTDQDYHTGGGGTNVPPGSAKIGVDKIFNTATKDEMTWTVKLDVPATGLNKAIMVDELPRHGRYRDTLNVESLNVTGLDGDESYELTQSRGKFTLTFYKDGEHTQSGLNATGRARQITVTFKTDNDPEWVANSRNTEHENKVSFQGDNSTVYDSDKGVIARTGIEKTSYGHKVITVDGVEKIAFEYTIDLYGVTEDDLRDGLVVTDDYDETRLEFLDISGKEIGGFNTWWVQVFQNGYNGGERKETKFVPGDADGKLTFNITSDNLPRDNGKLYPRYQIRYYLVAKDSATLLQESLGKEDHIVTIDNKASWGDSEDNATVDYSYPGVTKSNIAPSSANDQNVTYDPNTGNTGFKIVINPDKLELNGGDPMTLEDVFTDNLSVDYSSIKVVVEPADGVQGEQTVTYDYKGNKGIYNIPDKCKVTITYDARVIGKPGEWVSYGNTATMKGFTDSASGSAQMSGSGEGGFNIYSVKLFKYSAGHMERGLEGAQFTLVDEYGNPIVYPDAANNAAKRGQPITFTTDEKGYVNINLNEQEDGVSLQKGITYYLKETMPPSSHAINNTTYRFTISDNPNYSNYEYHSGDIVKVYDWPIMGRIEIKKTIEGPSNLTEEDKKRITFEVTGKYSDGTTIKADDEGYPIALEDLAAYTAEERAALADYKVSVSLADFTHDVYVMADLVDGTYTVKETAATLPGYSSVQTSNTTYEVDTDGQRKEGAADVTGQTEATVTITNQSKYAVNYTNTYTNKKAGYDLNIKKVNADGSQSLFGAIFKLEKKVGDDYRAVSENEGSVDANGNFSIPYANKDTGVTLASLEPGDYRITEVQTPARYKAIGDGVIEFSIDEQGNVATASGDSNEVSYTADANANDALVGTLSVKNEVKHSYTVTKVDGANVSLKLPGAVFGVWESSYPATTNITDAMDADAEKTDDPLWKYTTDANGRFEIQKEDHAYEEGKLYFFKEISAPAGYELPDDPVTNYFFFSYDGVPPTAMKPVDLGAASRSQTITNDLPNLEVKKLWKNLKGDNLNKQDIDVDEIDFVVYQKATVKTANGTVVSEGEETRFPDDQTTYTIEYLNGQWATVTIPDAPAMGRTDDGNLIYYTYRVEEDTPEGWVANVTMSDSGREATITNTPEPMEITVKKVWDVPAFMDQNMQNAWAQFQVWRDAKPDESGDSAHNGWVKVVVNNRDTNQLDNSNNWEMTFEVEAGGTYHIVETDAQCGDARVNAGKFDISYTVGDATAGESSISEAGVVVITNTYNEPYLEIVKDWQTETEHSDYEIWLNIYRRNVTQDGNWELWYGEGKDQDKAKLDFRQNWKLAFRGDALQTNGEEYEYYVEEYLVKANSTNWQNVVQNFYISYSATQANPLSGQGTITVTNSDKYDGQLTVDKQWKNSLGVDLADENVPNSVKVILQRAEAELVGSTVTLNAKLTKGDGQIVEKQESLTVKNGTTVSWKVDGNYDIVSNNDNYNGWSCDVPFGLQNSGYYQAGIEGTLEVNSDVSINVTVSGGDSANINAKFEGEYEKPEIGEVGDFEDVPGTEQTLTKPNWTYTWENLKTDAGDGKAYVYSVREIAVNGRAPEKAGFISVVDPADGVQNGAVTLTNTEIPKGSLKITKQVTVNGAPTTTDLADGAYTFRAIDSAGTRHTATIEITNGQSNTAVIDNLPEGACVVQEIASTNTNVEMDLSEHTVNIVGNTTADSANVAAVTITNAYVDTTAEVSLDVLKVDASDNAKYLEGAEFSLIEIDGSAASTSRITTTEEQMGSTDKYGKLSFDGLKVGSYYQVTETKPPKGYITATDASFYIKVTDAGIELLKKESGAPSGWHSTTSDGIVKSVVQKTADSNATATVTNTPGSALPNTGGSGTTPLTVLGLAIIAGAVIALLAPKKRSMT